MKIIITQAIIRIETMIEDKIITEVEKIIIDLRIITIVEIKVKIIIHLSQVVEHFQITIMKILI